MIFVLIFMTLTFSLVSFELITDPTIKFSSLAITYYALTIIFWISLIMISINRFKKVKKSNSNIKNIEGTPLYSCGDSIIFSKRSKPDGDNCDVTEGLDIPSCDCEDCGSGPDCCNL